MVLDGTELAGVAESLATRSRHQLPVQGANEIEREQTLLAGSKPSVEGHNVVEDILRITSRYGPDACFEGDDIGERRHRALDARACDSLSTQIGAYEQIGVGKELTDAGELTESEVRFSQFAGDRRYRAIFRARRQGARNEGSVRGDRRVTFDFNKAARWVREKRCVHSLDNPSQSV